MYPPFNKEVFYLQTHSFDCFKTNFELQPGIDIRVAFALEHLPGYISSYLTTNLLNPCAFFR